MAVAFKAVGPAGAGSTSTISVDYPASKAAGDLAIIVVGTGIGAVTTPTGFTVADFVGVGSGGNDVDATRLYVFYRFLDGSEGASVVVDRGAGYTIAGILLYTGADTTTPLTLSTGKTQSPASTAASTNAIATKASDGSDMFLACYAHARDALTASARTSSAFANVAATVTNRFNDFTNAAGGGGILVEEGDPSGNSTGDVSHSMTITSSVWVSFLVRINAAAAGPTSFTLTADQATFSYTGQAANSWFTAPRPSCRLT
jgi:hypothetical protein